MLVTQAAISVRRACVEYDGVHVLEDVDLEIQPGEFVAVLGPNGSGKTTLIKAITGLEPIAHGHIDIFGSPVAKPGATSRIAYVPQRLPQSGSVPVSVREAVMSGAMQPRGRWIPYTKEQRAKVRTALERVNLWDRRHDRLDTLSGGQQRRVMVARALAGEADIFVLDEPTAGVDSAQQKHLADVLVDLHREGRTILVITHELGPIAHAVTRVIVLGRNDRGSVVYDGATPPDDYLHDHVHHHEDE